MGLFVSETSRRYARLLSYGKLLGFVVDEKEDRIEWTTRSGKKYVLFPFANEKDMLKQFDNSQPYNVAVLLDDAIILDGEKNSIFWNEIEILCEMIERKKCTVESIQFAWEIRYSSLKVVDLVNKISNSKYEMKSTKQTHDSNTMLDNTDDRVDKTSGPQKYVSLLESYKGKKYNSIGKKMFVAADDELVIQLVSKRYTHPNYDEYWYSIHQYQIDEMHKHKTGFYSFGFSDKNITILIRNDKFEELLPKLTISPNGGDTYWHVKFNTKRVGNYLKLKTKKSEQDIDIACVDGIIVIDDGCQIKSQSKKMITISSTDFCEVNCRRNRR